MKSRYLLAVVTLTTCSAWGLSFKSNMQPLKLPVTIALSLPPEQPESAPGEITVGLQRMCGDGDVAHLAKENPTLEFVPQSTTKLNVVMGYWVTDGDESANPNYVPTASSFIPVAYIKDANIGNNPGSVTTFRTFLPVNHALPSEKNGMEILASEVVGSYKNATRAWGNTKSYRVFSGVFTCMDMDDAGAIVGKSDSNYKFMPSMTELTNQFSHDSGLSKNAFDAFNVLTQSTYNDVPRKIGYKIGAPSGSLLNFSVDSNNAFTPLKIFLDKNESSLKAQMGASEINGGNIANLDSTTAFSKLSPVMDLHFPDLNSAPTSETRPVESAVITQADLDGWVTLLPNTISPRPALGDSITSEWLTGWDNTHPTDADKVAFLNAKISQWKANFGGSIPSTDSEKIAYCQSLGLDTNQTTPNYRWEVFPMNTSCKKLFNSDPGTSTDSMDLATAYNQLFRQIPTYADLMTYQTNFFKLKKQLGNRFFVANAVEVLQDKVHGNSDIKISHANCFNTNGKPLISRLIGSYPLRYKKDSAAYTVTPNALNHIHPEPLFALSDWKEYKESDVIGLWGQVVNRSPSFAPGSGAGLYASSGVDISGTMYGDPSLSAYTPATPIPAEEIKPAEWGIYMPVNDKTQLNNNNVNSSTFKGPAVNILFKIRSIGGNCPGFC